MTTTNRIPSFTPLTAADIPVTVIDCTGGNLAAVNPPAGQLMAGYITGSNGVPWTAAQLAAHPGAVQIDQSPIDTPADETADVYDYEARAGTLGGLPEWVHNAWTSWQTGKRPGQRQPTVYCSTSSSTPVVNELLSAGITDGVHLWVAGTMTEIAAQHLVVSANGPFPIVGVQYAFHDLFDVSCVSAAWLGTVSKPPAPVKSEPGTQTGWAFCHKCQGLFYGPGESVSMCPRGETHDGGGSHDYVLPFSW